MKIKENVRLVAKMKKIIIFTTVIAVLSFSWLTQPLQAAEPIDVSMIQLISNPKDYDGKVVRVVGFVSLEFEGTAIYLHQDDYKHSITRNGLWVAITDEIRGKNGEFDQRYVMVEGTFSMQVKGHMSLWSGSLQKVSKMRVWFERKKNEK